MPCSTKTRGMSDFMPSSSASSSSTSPSPSSSSTAARSAMQSSPGITKLGCLSAGGAETKLASSVFLSARPQLLTTAAKNGSYYSPPSVTKPNAAASTSATLTPESPASSPNSDAAHPKLGIGALQEHGSPSPLTYSVQRTFVQAPENNKTQQLAGMPGRSIDSVPTRFAYIDNEQNSSAATISSMMVALGKSKAGAQLEASCSASLEKLDISDSVEKQNIKEKCDRLQSPRLGNNLLNSSLDSVERASKGHKSAAAAAFAHGDRIEGYSLGQASNFANSLPQSGTKTSREVSLAILMRLDEMKMNKGDLGALCDSDDNFVTFISNPENDLSPSHKTDSNAINAKNNYHETGVPGLGAAINKAEKSLCSDGSYFMMESLDSLTSINSSANNSLTSSKDCPDSSTDRSQKSEIGGSDSKNVPRRGILARRYSSPLSLILNSFSGNSGGENITLRKQRTRSTVCFAEELGTIRYFRRNDRPLSVSHSGWCAVDIPVAPLRNEEGPAITAYLEPPVVPRASTVVVTHPVSFSDNCDKDGPSMCLEGKLLGSPTLVAPDSHVDSPAVTGALWCGNGLRFTCSCSRDGEVKLSPIPSIFGLVSSGMPEMNVVQLELSIRNLAFEKHVVVRCSLDGWMTYTDTTANYARALTAENDIFIGEVAVPPPSKGSMVVMEFALRVSYGHPKNEVVWHNNFGSNFRVNVANSAPNRQRRG